MKRYKILFLFLYTKAKIGFEGVVVTDLDSGGVEKGWLYLKRKIVTKQTKLQMGFTTKTHLNNNKTISRPQEEQRAIELMKRYSERVFSLINFFFHLKLKRLGSGLS